MNKKSVNARSDALSVKMGCHTPTKSKILQLETCAHAQNYEYNSPFQGMAGLAQCYQADSPTSLPGQWAVTIDTDLVCWDGYLGSTDPLDN